MTEQMTHDTDKPPEQEAPPSKSQAKREHKALQELGEALVALSEVELERVPLAEHITGAVRAARSMDRSALRRQIRYLGKLLSRTDAAPVRAAVDEFSRASRRATALHHRLEHMRERLIAEGDAALDDLLEWLPLVDVQQVRQFTRNARRERDASREPRAARALFRYLRTLAAG